ncbi:nucleotide pyrophosphohydrolase [Nocardioides sp. KIGAM211]|uniref:Nucleotide pyrophosphohydrolase n=2 Tax=Nocardioides luti TaxID=2761101 RepID=A0A7X0RF68_9ACTN|nr:MazG nucleotide pyrophosphohydrolase domain-containing protein [Nocardioides luti]MBB6627055.1 nucleotide pyrophosphohydrolase [Nocardioides luti]
MRAECDWKRGQTHRSLARYLLEETHETLELLDAWDETPGAVNDPEHLSEELGDLLLQVYFHAAIAEERGDFTLDDVARGLIAKMRRRNPHVFGGAEGGSAAEINEVWQAIKAAEKPDSGVTSGLPMGLPALLYADKVLDRLDRRGLLAGSGEAATESGPGPVAEAPLGDRLLALVAEARAAGVDPEQELRDAVRRLLEAAGD